MKIWTLIIKNIYVLLEIKFRGKSHIGNSWYLNKKWYFNGEEWCHFVPEFIYTPVLSYHYIYEGINEFLS